MAKHYGYLKGIGIVTGEKYFLNGELVILENVIQSESYLDNFKTKLVFKHCKNNYIEILTDKELMGKIFKRYETYDTTVSINNDTVYSLLYSLKGNSFVDKYLGIAAKAMGENLDEYLIRKHNLPHKVFFNDKKKATTLLFGNEATIVKACKGDKYDREKGFLMAFFQKQSGLSKTQAKRYLKSIIEQE